MILSFHVRTRWVLLGGGWCSISLDGSCCRLRHLPSPQRAMHTCCVYVLYISIRGMCPDAHRPGVLNFLLFAVRCNFGTLSYIPNNLKFCSLKSRLNANFVYDRGIVFTRLL
jgi:hypothetical protein